MPALRKYSDELRDLAVRLTCYVIDGGDSQKSACVRIGGQLEIPPSTPPTPPHPLTTPESIRPMSRRDASVATPFDTEST